MSPKKKLGEMLVDAGLIDSIQLQSALGHQKQWGVKLGTSLIEMGFIKEGTLTDFLGNQMKAPGINLSEVEIPEEVFTYIPKDVAVKYTVVPVELKEGPGKKTLVVAIADPTNLGAIDDLQFSTGCKIEPRVAAESVIQKIIKEYGEKKEKGEEAIELGEEISGAEGSPSESEEMEVVRDVIEQTATVKNGQVSSNSVGNGTEWTEAGRNQNVPEITEEMELKEEDALPPIQPEEADSEAVATEMTEVQAEVEAVSDEPPEEAPTAEAKPITEPEQTPQPSVEGGESLGNRVIEDSVSAADWESIKKSLENLDSLKNEITKTKMGVQSILAILINKGHFSKEEFLKELQKRKSTFRTGTEEKGD
jgi:type IV pilus assembly protein PilB